MSKPLRKSSLIELVETHNIALSLKRLGQVKGWNNEPTKRAVYHAFAMSGRFDNGEVEQLRIALQLP